MQISYFTPLQTKTGDWAPGVKPAKDMHFDAYLAGIRDGQWADVVLDIRAGRKKKEQAPGVTPSGMFAYRSSGSLSAHSTVLALDFDYKDNGDDFQADVIAADPYVYAMHRSISGKGWVVYVRIDGSRHADAYLALEKHFADSYQAIADPSGKDVSRFRFVSHDPEAFINPQARVWKKYLPKKQAMPQGKAYIYTNNDVEHCINQLRGRGIDITDSYYDWVGVGMALAKEFGEAGRAYFHDVSAISSKYDATKCDKKYDNLLKTSRGLVGIGRFFWLCSQHGLEIKTPRTAHIERVATMQRKVVGANGGHIDPQAAAASAKKLLDEQDMISGDDVDAVIAQVMNLPDSELNNAASDDLIADLKEFLRTYDIKFNEITQNLEIDGEPQGDRDINSIYIKGLELIGAQSTKGKSVTKDLIFAILDSDFTPSYNPFHDFFAKHQNLRPKGLIDKLIGCIRVEPILDNIGREVDGNQFAELYIRKWLLSCVASWHGTYSVMFLVLTGRQGEGKTNFFRRLLPDELMAYFADNSLDGQEADVAILMCKKGIICDDEFEGRSKADYKRLKSILSKQTFTVRKPYGKIAEDMQRIAVLCGTSNESEVINDPTGNRRIIPVPVASIDWDAYYQIDKAALWMELYNEWKKIGDGWMLTREEVAVLNKLTTRNQQVMTEEEAIWMFFSHPDDGGLVDYLTNTEIRNHIETHSKLRLSPKALGLALQKSGFKNTPKKLDGAVKLVYGIVKKQFRAEFD